MAQQQMTAAQQHEILERVRAEVSAQTQQEFMTKISQSCFEKCVPAPSSKLSSSEQRCLALCIDRYVDTVGLVSQTMVERGKREANQ